MATRPPSMSEKLGHGSHDGLEVLDGAEVGVAADLGDLRRPGRPPLGGPVAPPVHGRREHRVSRLGVGAAEVAHMRRDPVDVVDENHARAKDAAVLPPRVEGVHLAVGYLDGDRAFGDRRVGVGHASLRS